MLRGYRGILCAIAGLALLGAGPAPNQRADPDKQSATGTIQQSLDRIANAQTEQAEPGEYQAPCRDREYNNRSDLCAQWYAARAARDAADWAYWALFWTAISLAVSGLGLIALLITIRQGREANRIAQSVASNAIKPHVYPESVVFCEVDGPLVAVRITLKNYGGGIAKAPRVFVRDYRMSANARKTSGFRANRMSLPDLPPQGTRKIFRYFVLNKERRAKVISGEIVLVIRLTYEFYDELGNKTDTAFSFVSGGDMAKDEHWYIFDMETLVARREHFGGGLQADFIAELEESEDDQDANQEKYP
jgi:hypothetical protein